MAAGEDENHRHFPQLNSLAHNGLFVSNTTITINLMWCLMSVHSGTLTSRSVHPASPVLLTKNGPLVLVHSNVHVQLSNKDFLHI